ncbi:MAG: Alpha-monoglucosyldiacylglycerol synthase [Pelotomaculum sp. PtaB.Bin104]|nr:MAG: Alpha-monoglucosyldiacylglycerol synthase [Pelotomaculum sp. PtaB.Bin104]
MKIGIFTDSYLPYTSGVVRSIQTFSEELTSNGHEIFIFAPSYRDCRKENRVFRFSSIPSPTNRDFTLAMPFSIKFKPTIKKLNLDLIHVHSPFLLGRLGARYARRLGIPLVFTFHTLYDQYVHYVPFAQSLTKDLAQRISRGFCNHCDLVIVPTTAVEDYLRKIGVSASIRVVPTGIKVMNYQSGDQNWLRRRFNLPEGEKILLFVGRLGQEKNINFLMECFAKINEEMRNTRLVLVGGGPEEEELKNKATELGVAEQVTFTGVLPPTDVVNCYAGADIFVFSSVSETQGIVIGEAKAAGLPVVAVAAFGVSEMVDDGIDGFLTELEPVQFIEKIILLLNNDDLYQRMSRNARENAENLSTANCTAKLINCYSQAIERS